MTERKIIGQAFALSIVGAAFFNILPLYLGTAQDHFALTPDETGLIGSFFFFGYTLATVAAFFILPRANLQYAALIALAAASLAISGTVAAESFFSFSLAIFLAGASYSFLYGLGTSLIGALPGEVRNFGWKIALEAIFGGILLVILPSLVLPRFGFAGLAYALVLSGLLIFPLFRALPKRQLIKENVVSGLIEQSKHVWLLLLALVFFFAGETMAWSFVERVGNDQGFEPTLIGNILAISLAFAVAGSLSEAYGASYLGYGRSIALAVIVFLVALFSLTRVTEDNVSIFAAGAWLANFSIGFGLPVLVAMCAHHDASGRYVVLTVPAIGVGAILGPALAGLAITYDGYAFMLSVSGVLVLLAGGIVAAAAYIFRGA